MKRVYPVLGPLALASIGCLLLVVTAGQVHQLKSKQPSPKPNQTEDAQSKRQISTILPFRQLDAEDDLKHPYRRILYRKSLNSEAKIELQTTDELTRDKEAVEDEAEVILDRIRWFKERHPEIKSEKRLQMVREDYEQRQLEKARVARPTQVQTVPNWLSVGPTNGAGRISSIAVHPTAMGTVYVGADGGGVWETTDGGSTWVSLTDSINNLNVGAIALAPSSPNIVYVGTGSEHALGIGLLKSSDGGSTWQFPSSVIAYRFFRISVHPTNPLELVAGTTSGGLRSTDGGVNWAIVIPSNPYYSVNDIKRDPTSPSILYAAATTSSGGRILKSTNGGASFSEKMAGLPSNADTMSIAIAPSNPLVLYVLTSIQSNLTHVYKSTDGGETWTDLPGVSGSADNGTAHILGGQHWHDNTIIVSPPNSNNIIAGGVRYRRSTDGGQTWAQPFCGPNFNCSNVHADWTDQQYQGSNLWIANDGGVFSSPDDGNTVVEHDTGLVIREYYAMSNHPVQINGALAGSQDNGTDYRSGSGGTVWFSMPYCDSFDSAINRDNPNIAYGTCQGGQITRTKQFGTNPNIFSHPPATEVAPLLPAGESWPFFTRLVMDLNNSLTLYTLTNTRVWRTTDGGDSWAPLPTTTTDGSSWGSPSSIALSRSNPNVLMTSSGSSVFRSMDGGNTWVRKTVPNVIYSLEIDPNDPTTAYVGSYDSFFMTNDGGNTWVTRSNGLPQGAIFVVRVDPTNSKRLYCGTYNGVYISTDTGNNWLRLGSGLPSVFVEDLRITNDGSILRAATYGRGVWEYQLSTLPTPPPSPTANGASNVTSSSFTTNWSVASGATGYLLDVSTNAAFSNLVSGYQNLDVGNVLSRSVSGLSSGSTYYYRLRAYNDGGISNNSGAISVKTSTLRVTNTNDSGTGSLRQAISDAASGSVIDFLLPLGSTITLTSGELLINKDLTISGPGANSLTVRRSDVGGTSQFRILRITSGDTTISGLTVSNGNLNSITGSGGGMQNESSGIINIMGCMIAGNSAGSGGGIYSNGSGTMNLVNSTVSGNSGGGIAVYQTALNVTNSTISGNTAENGGGLNCQLTSVNITYSTISGNSAPFGGGFYVYSTSVNSKNTVIAGNTATHGPDVYSGTNGQLSSLGYNIIGNNSGANIATQLTDQIGTPSVPLNPKLGPLADNGGPTQTCALLSGSPAIDNGGPFAGLATDQRGFARKFDDPTIPNALGGDGSDIGALEANSSPIQQLQFDAMTYTVSEGAQLVNINVTRSGATSGVATVNYATSDGTAAAGSDYTATSGTLSFASGEMSKTFIIPITSDSLHEPNETVNLTLSNVTGNATLGTSSTALLTILDDDPLPGLSINDVSVAEGNSGTGANFTVSLSVASGQTVTVNYATASGTATAGIDYLATSGTLTFTSGQSSKTIAVTVNGDTTAEPDETFFVDLSSPANATITRSRGTGTITATSGRTKTGVFRPSTGELFLKNANSSGFADTYIIFGNPGDYPVAGDWNGDGIDSVGIYRNGVFYLRNTNSTGFADIVVPFGNPGDQPVVGDWNGDGVDTIGIYRNGTFILRNSNTAGPPDLVFTLGNPGDVGIAGDWNGDGIVTCGVFRPSNGIVYLRNSNSTGFSDLSFVFGNAGDKPVAGDWNADGIDTIGIYRNGVFYLSNSNATGFADTVFVLGNSGDFPIAGNWNGSP